VELPKVYTTEQVAEMLGYAQISVRDMCRLGKIPCNKRGSRYVVTEQQLHEYLVGKPYQPKAKKQK
jgi:excisionase family DNA binding protein